MSSFVIMNVVVGIVVNSISEVQLELSKEKEERRKQKESGEKADISKEEQIKEQLSALRERIDELEKLL